MWDLPEPGLEPVSPALAGGFLGWREREGETEGGNRFQEVDSNRLEST